MFTNFRGTLGLKAAIGSGIVFENKDCYRCAAMWQRDFSELLRRQFSSKKKRNSRFSVRSYAKQLEVAPSVMSELLSSKKKDWALSSVRAIEILDKMQISRAVRGRMLLKMGQDPAIKRESEILSDEACKYLLDWRYNGVLLSLDLPTPFSLPELICGRFGLKPSELDQIIKSLHVLGLVEKDTKTKVWRRKPGFWFSADDVPNAVLHQHHHNQLKLAQDALSKLPLEQRDFTSMSFVGSMNRIKLLKEEIRKFYERAMLIMDAEETNTDVFRISVNLFPLGLHTATVEGQKK